MTPRLRNVPAESPEERRRRAAAIGARLRALRVARGMSQADVAGDLFSKAYISALETGVAAPSMRALEFIAAQLKVSPDWFLTRRPDGEEVALPATISRAWLSDGRVYVELDDGRAVGMPLARSKKLSAARIGDFDRWEVTEFGRAIAWPALGEEIGIEDFLGLRVLSPEEVGASRFVADASPAPPAGAPSRPRRAGPRAGGRYAPVAAWLAAQRASEVQASFAELERVLGRPLPPSARRYTAPWHSAINPLARAIKSAGWRASADLGAERVTFRRR